MRRCFACLFRSSDQHFLRNGDAIGCKQTLDLALGLKAGLQRGKIVRRRQVRRASRWCLEQARALVVFREQHEHAQRVLETVDIKNIALAQCAANVKALGK